MVHQWRLTHQDLLFLVETLMPGSRDPELAANRVQRDEELLDTMLDDERVFRRLVGDEEALVHVSPWLFFTVLLRRSRRELQQEAFTQERRSRQKVVIFDVEPVIALLEQAPVQDYLAHMLASFTRTESMTVPVRMHRGIWRRYRTNDLDAEGLIRYSQNLDEPFRFEPYKRIGDVCLFLSGMFPEYIDAQYRYPLTHQVRLGARGRLLQRLEDYEAHGRAFYQLAAEHDRARLEGLEDVLVTLSQNFILAEKPLTFLAKRYLRLARHKLFDLQ